jgi:TolA-binding protein
MRPPEFPKPTPLTTQSGRRLHPARRCALLVLLASAPSFTLGSEPHPPTPPAPAPAVEAGHGPEAPAPSPPVVATATPTAGPPRRLHEVTPDEIDSLLRIGEAKTQQGDFASAEIAFQQILSSRASNTQDRDALLGLARVYRRKAALTKAAAVYEKLIKEFPGDPLLPTAYLELGRTHRALGAHRLAISRFYSVLNTTLKLTEEGSATYRQLARTAQFEIAETYFVSGNYTEAGRFFSRLNLLDLAPVDRARAQFKAAYAFALDGDHERAVATLRGFLEQNADDENAPEARYLLSVSLRRLGLGQEALAAALDLLRSEKAKTGEDPKRWIFWQRKTGNQLANEFYEQGDFASALAIYQSLASLSPEPQWRLPVVYQMGLCYERLRAEAKAREQYTLVVAEARAPEIPAARRSEMDELATMASWRLEHIAWENSTRQDLDRFFQTPPPATSAPEANPPPPSPRVSSTS